MGCQIKRLGQVISDLPLSEIFTTRWRSKLGKTAQNLQFWALSVVLGAIPKLMGCQIKRLGQAISDLPLSEFFTTRWCSKLGKTAQNLHFCALSVVLGAMPRLVGYHWSRLGQASSELPLSVIGHVWPGNFVLLYNTNKNLKWHSGLVNEMKPGPLNRDTQMAL